MRKIFLLSYIVFFGIGLSYIPSAQAEILPSCITWKASHYGACIKAVNDKVTSDQACIDNYLKWAWWWNVSCGFADNDKPAELTDILRGTLDFSGGTNDPALSLISSLTDWLMGVAAAVIIVLVVYSGFQYISSAVTWAEDGKKILTNALVGFVITILSYTIIYFILQVALNLKVNP